MSWRDRAACVGADTDLFFPIGSTGFAVLQVREAKQVCAPCPVRSLCLDWAVKLNIDHGVWGGLSEEERRSLKRRQTRKRAATAISPVVSKRVSTA